MRVRALLVCASLLTCNKEQSPKLTTPKSSTSAPNPGVSLLQNRAPVTLKILSPREGETINTKSPTPLTATFSLSNYELQPDGQRLHIVIDNNPYETYSDLSKPFISQALLAPGTHTLRAFAVAGPLTPGASPGESLKDPSAFAMVSLVVGKANGKSTPAPADPLLTFSRPSGEYTGEKARKVMLDFWLKNAELGPGKFQVKYTIDNGTEHTISSWEALFLVGLTPGDHSIELWLVDAEGKEVPGVFNRTTRKFTLKEVAPKTLYTRIGGQATIESILQDLFLLIASDEELNKSFKRVDLIALQRDLAELLCERSGGPCQYKKNAPKDAYPKMRLTKKDFPGLISQLTNALAQNQISDKESKELVALFTSLQRQLLTK